MATGPILPARKVVEMANIDCFTGSISSTSDFLDFDYLKRIIVLELFLLSAGLSVRIVENASSCLSSKPIRSLHLNQRGHYSAHSAHISEITGRKFLYQRNVSGTNDAGYHRYQTIRDIDEDVT